MQRTGLLCIIIIIALSACQANDSGTNTPAPEEVAPQSVAQTAAPTTEVDSPTRNTPTEEAAVTPEVNTDTVLTVWIIDTLLLGDESDGQTVFSDELAEFDEGFPDIQVEIFTKRVDGPGGMLDYMRTASPVAPTVLPDLILVNQETLIRATNESLIVPLEQVVGGNTLNMNYYDVASDLATVNDLQAGVPYVLTTEHSLYRTTLFTDGVPNAFTTLLEQETETPVPFTFAAGPVTGVNRTLLNQYMAAGGPLTDDEGNPTLDVGILTDVLAFYAEASEAGIINPSVFQYATSDEVWAQYLNGQAGFAVIPSRSYLLTRDELRSTGLTSLPTPEGEPTALVDGLYWAMVTREPEQQTAAVALINFLLDPINQGEFTQASGWLPSQPAALTVWGTDDPYTSFGDTLLQSGIALPPASVRAVVGPPMQQALEDVLLNGAVPAQAANAAVLSVTGAGDGN